MIKMSNDIFENYELPFKTYFEKHVEHDIEVHEEMELVWILKGNAIIECEGEKYNLTDNSIFMIYMHRKHSIKTSENSVLISYRFSKDHLSLINLPFDSIPFRHRVYTFKELSQKYHQVPLLITQILKLLISPKPSPCTRYRIIGYYNLFIFELHNMLLKEKYMDVKSKNYDPYLIRIQYIIDYIHENAHKKITLDMLSSATNISTSRLSHFISASLGISFSEYLQNVRLEKALVLLSGSDTPISQVALQSGFSDVKYLNQMIKRKFHMTALKYRKYCINDDYYSKINFKTADFIRELQECLLDIEKSVEFKDTYGLNRNMSFFQTHNVDIKASDA